MKPRLPSVDSILRQPAIAELVQREGQGPTTELIRSVLSEHRRASTTPSLVDLVEEIGALATVYFQPSLRPVINASGVIIHTNLGRAPLSADAVAAMEGVSRGYSNLEFDLEQGMRGARSVHVEQALTAVTGAEAGMVVNNNASALLLALTELCRDAEVVISRGQAVEIGGGFRIPDVMSQSGARLVEVGTTNRTYISDYESAISVETAALVRVHSSNFRVSGFTHSVSLAEMAELARSKRVLLMDDLGSGCLLDTSQFGLSAEPLVQQSVQAGADLVMFSGDKLLGGPQAGIIVGRRRLIDRLKRHPLARALRMDKGSLAALHATLRHYQRGEALSKLPVWQMISMPEDRIRRRANRWRRASPATTTVQAGRSMIGGGSLPEESLPTTVLAISQAEGIQPEEVARELRMLPRPIIGRVARGELLLDPRTVDPGDDSYVATQLSRLTARSGLVPRADSREDS
ncbi:MAG TPA: L-seryl-tRNA(Sec) selenium transferase [Dehalococcoidia bacterium]|nr:L-seryl-tRNA(Sec) selenium transferase [Dehalococcoidia bacterium]